MKNYKSDHILIEHNQILNWSLVYELVVNPNAFRVFKPFIPKSSLVNIYFATMRNIVEYCAPQMVGINDKLSTKLTSIQSRVIIGHHLWSSLCVIHFLNWNCADLMPLGNWFSLLHKIYRTFGMTHNPTNIIPEQKRHSFSS